MMFYIQTINDSGSGMKYKTKEEFMTEIGKMIDDCMENGGTFFSVDVDADASCFYAPEDSEKESSEEVGTENKAAVAEEEKAYYVFRRLLSAYVKEAGFDGFKEALEYCNKKVGDGGYAVVIENKENQKIFELRCHGSYAFESKFMTSGEMTILEDYILRGEWHD